jgi:hypothetical protein
VGWERLSRDRADDPLAEDHGVAVGPNVDQLAGPVGIAAIGRGVQRQLDRAGDFEVLGQ